MQTKDALSRIFWKKWEADQKSLMSICVVLTKDDTHLAEDILSESMLHSINSFVANHRGIRNLNAWIRKIIFNTYFLYIRKEKRYKEIICDFSRHQSFFSETIHINKNDDEFFYRFERALSLLPSKIYHVFILRIYGRSYSTIAQTLDISKFTVRKRMQMAKKHMIRVIDIPGPVGEKSRLRIAREWH